MFEFANPWFFLCLPLPVLIYYIWPQRNATITPFQTLWIPFFKQLQSQLPSLISADYLSLQQLGLVWTLLIFAAAGPRTIDAPVRVDQAGHPIFLILDISDSMGMNDFIDQGYINTRLFAVKQTAKAFIQERTNDPIGLILFGTQAYLQTPLTFDHQTINERIDDATVGLAGHSTSIGDAIGLGIKHLKNTSLTDRIIILLTDGVNNSGLLSPEKAADLAQKAHIKIYTIGLGSGFDHDEHSLRSIAQKTNGQYFNASDTMALAKTYAQINAMETSTKKHAWFHPYHELYPWPLALALLIFLWRRTFL